MKHQTRTMWESWQFGEKNSSYDCRMTEVIPFFLLLKMTVAFSTAYATRNKSQNVALGTPLFLLRLHSAELPPDGRRNIAERHQECSHGLDEPLPSMVGMPLGDSGKQDAVKLDADWSRLNSVQTWKSFCQSSKGTLAHSLLTVNTKRTTFDGNVDIVGHWEWRQKPFCN